MNNPSSALSGQVAIVTGAASGIGRATAAAFAAAGTQVLLGDIAEAAGEAAAAELRAAGGRAHFIRLDVTDADSIARFRDAAGQRAGAAADIVVNVAGWGRVEPFVQNTPEFWRKVVDLNLMAPIAICRAFLDPMIQRGSGRIVNVASDAGRVGSLGETVYAGAKGGVIAFTKSLAREVARYNISANCVCPGPTDTPLMAAVPDKIKDAFSRVTPMRRLAKPEEIADAILFFAGPQANFVTGQVLSVSGGLTMVG
jgi:2-hydroxycyclohexanecarboxyl-CoA dehydrogenase